MSHGALSSTSDQYKGLVSITTQRNSPSTMFAAEAEQSANLDKAYENRKAGPHTALEERPQRKGA